jgi:hypothetical protein
MKVVLLPRFVELALAQLAFCPHAPKKARVHGRCGLLAIGAMLGSRRGKKTWWSQRASKLSRKKKGPGEIACKQE